MFAHILTPFSLATWVGVFSIYAVSCGPTHAHNLFSRTPVAGIDLTTLAPELSPAARIYLPGSSEFAATTIRWSYLEPPAPSVVIAPGTELDVAKIVGLFKSECFTCF
jgi:hypothetical protein